MQRVEIGDDVPRALVADAEIRHRGRRFNRLWIADPLHHVLRRIGDFTSENAPRGDVVERRPDETARASNAPNLMTRAAAHARDRPRAPSGIPAWNRRRAARYAGRQT